MSDAKQRVLATYDAYRDSDKSMNWIIQKCQDESGLSFEKVVDVLTKHRFKEAAR